MGSLTKLFNAKTLFHWPMIISMIGIGFVMLTAIAPYPTLGDAVLSPFMHMVQGIVQGIGHIPDVASSVFSNAAAGNILPQHAGDMWSAAWSGGASHGAAGLAGHIHGAGAITNQWQWFGGLSETAQSLFIEDAAKAGVPLHAWIADWCADSGITFTP